MPRTTLIHSTGSSAPSPARSLPRWSPKSIVAASTNWATRETLKAHCRAELACYTNDEIRQQLGCSLRSVTLKLELIRKIWQERKVAG